MRKVKKKPITAIAQVKKGRTHRATQSTISNYHTLLKKRAALLRQGKDEEASKLDAEIEAIGGLETYQDASVHGQAVERGGDSAKVLIQWLKSRRESFPSSGRIRCLEIGALRPDNLASCSSWIDNQPIDLRSLHPDIKQQDFFERPIPTTDDESFDLISCSLVLNFVPDPQDRGRMLRLMHQQLRQTPTSLLFLVLPLPCVNNSRYVTFDHLTDLMRCIGFEQMEERWKAGGKVAYWLYHWTTPSPMETTFKKRVLRDGPKMNNFAITL